jgi:glycosyltransferase involved in cell wall biosynthesis
MSGDKLKILWCIHLYPPKHNCGAEYVAHFVNKFFMGKGHETRILLHHASNYGIKSVYCYDGVDVFPAEENIIERLVLWADVLFTHLDYTQWTIGIANVYRKKVFHFIHNDTPYGSIQHSDRPQWIVYNSNAAKERLNYNHEGYVLHPPCDWRHYDINKDTSKNEYITLINLDQNKGGHILRQIALRMPDKKFLGVKGSYSHTHDDKMPGQITNQPGNVTVIDNTSQIMSVYERTRVLLMPSQYESWGRTATEAMCSGIPVICTHTFGLDENVGEAALRIKDRDDIDAWVEAIKKLDEGKEYTKYSKKAKARSRQLDPQKELEGLEEFVKEAYYRPY